ncbi:hypothetical protein [Rhodococcus globerulus]|uniref:Uncharacterized protein n=1 Tax=Rhodococcus globerulus TaxID=33008 RepID=A0ABU4C3K5_RHOGO|nr:hypothetical protein [Rhodococcus globerulus]MDV6271079.1 hypothetical protein [Rhodococcus globerulus]
MSLTADQRDTAIEAIERCESANAAMIVAALTPGGDVTAAVERLVDAERAVSAALPL